LKSYCGRISSASIRLAATPLLGCFFKLSSLWPRSPSGADDANGLGTLDVHDGRQTPLFRNAHQYLPLFYG
jgi:hypothetical protein